eukprot:661364-Prymnesium_polylepis.1
MTRRSGTSAAAACRGSRAGCRRVTRRGSRTAARGTRASGCCAWMRRVSASCPRRRGRRVQRSSRPRR